MDPVSINALTQIPFVLGFILFAFGMFKFFQRWTESKDKLHLEQMEKSEQNWREFLVDQRDSFLKSIAEITSAVSDLRLKQQEHSALLAQHDKKLDLAIAKMDARLDEHDHKIMQREKTKAELISPKRVSPQSTVD